MIVIGCDALGGGSVAGTQLNVFVNGAQVRLSSPTVDAGNVYLVLDGDVDSGYTLISSKPAPDRAAGPLSNDDVARISRGDTQGMQLEGISVGCDAAQRAAARGHTGYCGNVYGPLPLRPGKYVFVSGVAGDPTGRPGTSMTVLEVLPAP